MHWKNVHTSSARFEEHNTYYCTRFKSVGDSGSIYYGSVYHRF